MMQGAITELTLMGVFDRGIPNAERVVIRVDEYVDMASFVLLQAKAGEIGGAVPIRDSMFWFGNGLLEPGDWIFIYSAVGESKVVDAPGAQGAKQKMVLLHWQRSQTMFHTPEIVPILARIDALQIGVPAPPTAPSATQGLLGPSAQRRVLG